MLQPYRALIVDDEFQSRSLIRKLLLNNFPDIIFDEASSVAAAEEKIKLSEPDLVFLDIQMHGETGFDLLNIFTELNWAIIFTTAHSEFAVKAFRYSAIGYLIKPLDAEEFRAAVSTALKRLVLRQKNNIEQLEFLKQIKTGYKIPDKLVVPTAEGFLFVTINDILYCRAISNYTEFHLTNKQKLLSSHTLGYYNELLAEHNFFRIHRSYLVNLAYVKMYKRGDGGLIILNNGEEIEVARSNKDAFLKILKL